VTERDERWARPPRQAGEGVRIIPAEEAQAALEAGEAAGRRPNDQLRFGDVPPAPTGPRPAHRFPLPDSVDPAQAVSLPPLAPKPSPGPARRALEDRPPTRPESRLPEVEDRPPAGPGQAGRAPVAAETSEAGLRPLEPPPPPERPSVRTYLPPPAYTSPFEPAPTVGPASDQDPQPGWGRGQDPTMAWQPEQRESEVGGNVPDDRWAAADDRTTEMGVVRPAADPPDDRPEETISLPGAAPNMPHWTDPPTGEVPRLSFEDDLLDAEEGDDLEAWKALGSPGVRWRDDNDWQDAEEIADVVGDVEPLGALDSRRSERSDLYSFDEDFERVTSRSTGSNPALQLGDDLDAVELPRVDPPPPPPVPPPVGSLAAREARAEREARRGTHRVSAGTRQAPRTRRERPSGGPGGGERGGRLGVGVGLVVLLAIAYAVGPKALLVLSLVILTAAAAEAYQMVRSAGFRPATLLGIVATVGVILASYWKGIEAIPIVAVLFFAGAMAWYVVGIIEARPLANVAVTIMVFVWVAVLGAFAPVMLGEPHGKGLFLGAVVVAVVADICAFAVGRWIGSRPMAPSISPHKTVEGFVGGVVGAIVAGAVIGKEVVPWAGMKHGILLGLVVGLVAPLGDLFESMLKRDLGIKDSGSVLAGHGGVLDRFDGILIALPAAYFVATFFKL
jgi:phosphatidate cytidylyltransferase